MSDSGKQSGGSSSNGTHEASDQFELELWKACPRMMPIPSQGFLAFKVPLGSSYDDKLDEGEVFTPSMLMEKMTAKQIPVGLVVDCTLDSHQYHEVSEWDDWDVEYFKMNPEEINEGLPTEASVQKFFEKCAAFYNKNPSMIVGLMGRYGFQIAGYLFIRFLVERCRAAAADALAAFAAARAPGVYCPTVLAALARRYHPEAAAPACPAAPAWDPGRRAGALPGSRGGRPPRADFQFPPPAHPRAADLKRRGSFEDPNPKKLTLPTAPGSPLPPAPGAAAAAAAAAAAGGAGGSGASGSASPRSERSAGSSTPVPSHWFKAGLESTVSWPFAFGAEVPRDGPEWQRVFGAAFAALGLADQPETERGFYFPGAPARRLTKVKYLQQETFVTWRAVGHRALLFIQEDGKCHAIDKGLNCREVNLYFPSPDDENKRLKNTIIDGIFVDDHDRATASVIHRFLAFDLLVFDGENITSKSLNSRLQRLQKGVLNPRKNPRVAAKIPDDEPFRLRAKDYFSLKKTPWLLKTFLPQLTHPVSGLIFTPSDTRYALPGLGDPLRGRAVFAWEHEEDPPAHPHDDKLREEGHYLSERELLLSVNRLAAAMEKAAAAAGGGGSAATGGGAGAGAGAGAAAGATGGAAGGAS